MYHRYGRHGNRAWLHQRNRYSARFNRSLVQNNQVTIIHFHLQFANQERIIIVSVDQNGALEYGEEITVDALPPERKALPQDRFGDWKGKAEMEALHMFYSDLKTLGRASSDDGLRSYAHYKGSEEAKAFFPNIQSRQGKQPEELLAMYVDTFLKKYRFSVKEKYGAAEDYMVIEKIKNKATNDKTRSLFQGLEIRQLDFLAAIRALELLDPEALKGDDYFTRIEQLACIYINEYNSDEEVKRSANGTSARFSEQS